MSRGKLGAAALPGLAMLVLYYSLAVHMHWSLGGWPTAIGENGFPPALVTHASIAIGFFIAVLRSLFVLPILIVACALIRRWRGLLVYLGVYAGSVVLAFLLMALAPARFIHWWID